MSKTKRATKWPPIYKVTHRSGQASYQVDLGMVDGKRKRVNFPTKQEAEAHAEQARIARVNEGTLAFSLPTDIRLDAAKASQLLAPHGVTIFEAAKYYQKHVLAYKAAPPIKEVVEKYIGDSVSRNLRPRTIGDLKHRLTCFAADFGESKLAEITLDELKEWIADDGWAMRTRVNFLTKISQLYSHAIRHKWADSNLTEHLDRPAVDETAPGVFTVEQAERLLAHAQEFDLSAYIAIGFFAGIRSAEMARMSGRNVNFEDKTITVGADAAKKRSQRIVDMQPALLAWLEPCKAKLQNGGEIVDQGKFRRHKELLLEAAAIQEWPANGLRHSFGSYHFAMFRSADDTAHQMGNSAEVVHRYYKALVSKSEAEKFWALRPVSSEQSAGAPPTPVTVTNETQTTA